MNTQGHAQTLTITVILRPAQNRSCFGTWHQYVQVMIFGAGGVGVTGIEVHVRVQ
jgi:hypothetical protein